MVDWIRLLEMMRENVSRSSRKLIQASVRYGSGMVTEFYLESVCGSTTGFCDIFRCVSN